MIKARDLPGPVTLVEGTPSFEDLTLACRIAARFGKARELPEVTMTLESAGCKESRVVKPLAAHEVLEDWHV